MFTDSYCNDPEILHNPENYQQQFLPGQSLVVVFAVGPSGGERGGWLEVSSGTLFLF